MNDMKCPFCNKPLQPTLRQSDEYRCENYDCPRTNIEWVGSPKLWQELIRTRKQLDWAVHFLKEIRLSFLREKDNPARQNKWFDTALYMYNCAESFFDDYDKTNEIKGGNNE